MTAVTKIRAQLENHSEGITVASVASVLGIGRSTAAKHLATLEEQGHAVRTPGQREGARRTPDLWYPAPSSTAEPSSAEGDTGKDEKCASPLPGSGGEQGVTEPVPQDGGQEESSDSSPSPVPEDSSRKHAATDEVSPAQEETSAGKEKSKEDNAPALLEPGGEQGVGEPVPQDDSQEESVGSPPAEPEGAPQEPTSAEKTLSAQGATTKISSHQPVINPVSNSPRLAPGQLRSQVKEVLEASPEMEFSPTEISRRLGGRSIGAVQNALTRLVDADDAVLTQQAPRRYRAT